MEAVKRILSDGADIASEADTPAPPDFEKKLLEALLQSSLDQVYLVAPDRSLIFQRAPETEFSVDELLRQQPPDSLIGGHMPAGDFLHGKGQQIWQRSLSELPELGTLVVLHDVTDSIRVHFELAATVEHTEIIAAQQSVLEDSIPSAHILTSETGFVVNFNKAACALFGYGPSEIVGKQAIVLSADSKAWRKLFSGARPEPSGLNQEPGEAELIGRKKDGTTFPMATAIRQVHAPMGTYHSILLRDLTASRRRQHEFESARQKAEAATVAKSEFLANMSHEIRTPMNGILGMLSLLSDSNLTDEQRDCTQTAYSSAELLLTIINDILDFSKIEAGKLDIDPVDFSLSTLLNGALDLTHPQAEARKLNIVTALDESLSEFYHGDNGRLRQILINFLSNAIKFTEGGSVTLRVSVQKTTNTELASAAPAPAAPLHRLRFEVTDEGIGIAPDRLEHVFGKFTQAESSTTRRFGGTGLGLAICKQLVLLMQGEIGVESEVGKGSTFWFELNLPVIKGLATRAIINTDPKQLNARVLVAEDNLVNQKVARRFLERLGCQVSIAENGAEVVRMAQEGGFDLIFMDCQMPEMDGFEATRALRATQPTESMPIVAMTANAMASDKEQCLASGMDDFITKPISSSALSDMLSKWAKRRRASSGGAPPHE